MKHERTCVICGKKYSYCPNCSAYLDKPRWMFMFDDEKCKNIYDVLNAYKTNSMSADEAKAKLNRIDPERKSVKDPGFKATVQEIYKSASAAPTFKKDNSEKK